MKILNAKKLLYLLHRMFMLGVIIFFVGVVLSVTSVAQAQTATPEPGFSRNLDAVFLDQVNPLTMHGSGNGDPDEGFVLGIMNVDKFDSPAGFLNNLFPYLLVGGGLILFLMLVWAGAHLVVGSIDDPKAMEVGRNRVSAALIGFTLLFVTYWIAQLLEAMFGVNVLG